MTKIEFLVSVNNKTWEISELVKSIEFSDKLNDGCSKLEFSYVDDNLKLENGSGVMFRYDSKNIFSGIVFKHGHNKKGEITVTAYDQLRYAKAKDNVVVQKDTATTLTKRMCNYLGIPSGTLTDTAYVLATTVQEDKTWLDIIYSAISDTLLYREKWFCLRDEFGKVTLRDINDLKLDLVLGDKSLCYDFDYEKSIDEEFYNRIKIYVKGKDDATVGTTIVKDSEASIKNYGLLQYFEIMENKNASQAKSKAAVLLGLYNQETETLSLDCLGDTRVRAGTSFYGTIEDIKMENKRLKVVSVTHKYIPIHTMSLEVSL